jgi:hypothetical protein
MNLKDTNLCYLILDAALDGNGTLPYPLPPETDGPDELLTITGFSLRTDHDWSMKLAGMMPVGNWDQYSARETVEGSGVSSRRWPLFTLWADEDNWIEFSANCEDGGMRIRVNDDGTITTHDFGYGKQMWTQGSPLLVAFSFEEVSPGTRKLFVRASLGADSAQALNDVALPANVQYEVLRFRGAEGGHSNSGEVCEFRWFGGSINDAEGLGDALAKAFDTLDFLSGQ